MKALTFLDYYKKVSTEQVLSQEQYNFKFNKYFQFVYQKFKHELIIELFDNITIEREERDKDVPECILSTVYYLGEHEIIYDIRERGLQYHGSTSNGIDYDEWIIENPFMPETLDDFIGDCKRVGINLTFKEKISDEFNSKDLLSMFSIKQKRQKVEEYQKLLRIPVDEITDEQTNRMFELSKDRDVQEILTKRSLLK